MNLFHQDQRGTAVLFALFVLSALLSIALVSSTILLREFEFGKEVGYYIPAFFAADSGIEKILTMRSTPKNFTDCVSPASPCVLSNGASFWIRVRASGEDGCISQYFCIESNGEYRGTRRAIEVKY